MLKLVQRALGRSELPETDERSRARDQSVIDGELQPTFTCLTNLLLDENQRLFVPGKRHQRVCEYVEKVRPYEGVASMRQQRGAEFALFRRRIRITVYAERHQTPS